jgi:hypothetical protein
MDAVASGWDGIVMSTVASIMALALYKQLSARGIERPLSDCLKMVEAVIEETAGIGEEMEHGIREVEPV